MVSASPLLMVSDVECSRCDRGVSLFVRIEGRPVCARCWKRAGSPAPRPPTMHERHEAEVANHERMNARGGADRHLVRSGKA